MFPCEIDDTDRALVDRYISLLYADAYLKGDMDKAKQDQISIVAPIGDTLKTEIESELFRVRRQLWDRGIKVENTAKGVFDATVRGHSIRTVHTGDSAKMKATKVLQDMLTKPPTE